MYCLLFCLVYLAVAVTIKKNIRTVPALSESLEHWATNALFSPMPVRRQHAGRLAVKLQACCGDRCTQFADPLQMIGLSCCGEQVMNDSHSICCNGRIRDKKHGANYYTDCCGDLPIAHDEICCNGKINEGPHKTCCGEDAYDDKDTSKVCCNGTLNTVSTGIGAGACCGSKIYDERLAKALCCGDEVYDRSEFDACCNGRAYHTRDQICCHKIFERSYYDSCCYVFHKKGEQTNAVPFRSDIQCCDIQGVKNLDPDRKCPVR